MQGEPGSMQENPYYKDVVTEVYDFLTERVKTCVDFGIAKEKILIDPGFGFGKSVKHNLQLLNQLEVFRNIGCDLLVGWSRKSTIGTLLNQPANERLYGSLAAAVIAVSKGAQILRTHDVKATIDAIKLTTAVLQVE
jgi:dihydropteroate synthase